MLKKYSYIILSYHGATKFDEILASILMKKFENLTCMAACHVLVVPLYCVPVG